MRRNLYIAFVLLALCFGLPMEAQNQKRKRKSPNLALNIGKSVNDSLKVSYFNLGLLTNVYQLKGLGINVVSNVVKNDISGLTLSGFVNVCGGTTAGLQLSGISNINGYDVYGLSTAGFLNLQGHNNNGISLGGVLNVVGINSNGLALAGLFNLTGGCINGMAIGGLGNVAANAVHGVSLSGLLNASATDVYGLQLTSLLNIAGNTAYGMQATGLGNVAVSLSGLQLAGLANVVAEESKGLQFAAFNYADRVKGLQLGLVNLTSGNVKGVQLGLVNYTKDTASVKLGLVNISPRTRVQMMLTGGNTSKLNLGVRFLNRITYTMLGVGTPYLKFSDKFSGAVFYRAGLHWAPVRQLRLSGDLGYFHIENFKNKERVDVPARMYSLQARVNLEYQFTRKLGLILSGGYGMTRHYNLNQTFEKKPIVELGLVFF